MTRPYHIVVYGATGFTGQFVAAEAFRTRNGKKIAIAGRNKSKLEETLKFIEKENACDDVRSQVGVIVADNADDETILEMCRQCHCVVNCVGPYAFFGEQVVRACVETGTHHVDISGEPKFIQMCQLKYHEEAKAKGIHIVGTCGFDSVPSDVGLQTLREKFPGELTSAESFISFSGGGGINTGTYKSLVQAVVDKDIVKEQAKLIFNDNLPYVGPRLTAKSFGRTDDGRKYFVPFFGPDSGVVKRTQLFESSEHGKTPIDSKIYLTQGSIFFFIFMAMFGMIVFILTRFELGVNLLLRYPRLFSFGMFREDGKTRDDMSRSGFKVVFNGKGYSKKPSSLNEAGTPDRNMTLVFKGPDPGYIFTSISMVAAANTLLEDKLLNSGGVLTPASAFRGTKFVERLQGRGVQISVSE